MNQKDCEPFIKWAYEKMGYEMPNIHILEHIPEYDQVISKPSLEAEYNQKIRNHNKSKDISEKVIARVRELYLDIKLNNIIDQVCECCEFEENQYFGTYFEIFYSLNPDYEEKIKEFYDKGVFNIMYAKNDVYIIKMPICFVEKDDKITSIIWEDGYESFNRRLQ